MALPVNSIGIFPFMSLMGQLEPPCGQLEVDQRPGVNGTEILHIGDRGTPFALISRNDCESYFAAQQEYIYYKAVHLATNSSATTVIQSDVSTLTFGYYCKVLAVRLLRIQKTPVIVGGLQFTSGAILEAEWTLLAISAGG